MSDLTIVMYHYVRSIKNSRYPGIKGLETQDFKGQIAYLKSKYNIVDLDDVLMAVNNNKPLPQKAALLTFDDGYKDHYNTVFPVLDENGLSGVFAMPGKILKEAKVLDVNKVHFVLASEKQDKVLAKLFELLDYYRGSEFDIPKNDELFNKLAIKSRFDTKEVIFIKRVLQTELAENVRNLITDKLFKEYIPIDEQAFCDELYMSYDQVKTMKKHGMHFSVHGYDHYWLGNLPEDEMKNDINKALEVFEGIIDAKNWTICYPYGSYNDGVLNYIRHNGCKLGFICEFRTADLSIDDNLLLTRLDTNDFPTKTI